MSARSHAAVTMSLGLPNDPYSATKLSALLDNSNPSRMSFASSPVSWCGEIHTPGAGDPNPAQVSCVLSLWRNARIDSGMETKTTSQRPSHDCSPDPNE